MQTATGEEVKPEIVPSRRSVASGIKKARPILEGLVLIILAAWGVYGLVTVSTSPTPEGLVGDVLRGTSVTTNFVNYTVNGNAVFMAIFQATPHYDPSKGWPQYYPVPGSNGMAVGPFLPSEPSSTLAPFVKRFAIFTIGTTGGVAYGLMGGAGSNGTIRGSFTSQGPWPSLFSSFVYQSGVGAGAGSRDLLIAQADSQGNLSLWMSFVSTGTVQVSIGYSSVTFTPSRPFFYFGLATLIVAGIYGSARLVAFSKRPRDKKPDRKPVHKPALVPVEVPSD